MRRAVVAGLLVLATSCGKRGDPLPPLRRHPAPVQQLSIAQRGPFIQLEWSAPSRNTDGSEEVELEKVEVFRRVIDIVEPPREEIVSSSEETSEETAAPAEETEVEEATQEVTSEEKQEEAAQEAKPLEAEAVEQTTPSETASESPTETVTAPEAAPPPVVIPPFPEGATAIATLESATAGEALTYRDSWDEAFEGKQVEYAVRHSNRKGRTSGMSYIAQIQPLAPIEPPTSVRAEVDAAGVRLAWEPYSEERELKGDLGFNVYRRQGSELYLPAPLNSQAVTTPGFLDQSFEFGSKWCYAVRTVFIPRPEEPVVPVTPGEGEETPVPDSVPTPGPPPALIESLDSEEICITPTDTFAPPPPGNVIAVDVSEGILLSWDSVEADDLGGYLVYRATDDDGPFDLLTPEPLPVASYTDREVEPGVEYHYAVSAVDGSEPRNESPHSPSVAARAPQQN